MRVFAGLTALFVIALATLAAADDCCEADVLNANKDLVRSFYELAFNAGEPEEAVDRYVGDHYTQHNPHAANGPEAFIEFVSSYKTQFPGLHVNIQRMIAEEDLVVTHSLITTGPDDRGNAVVDIFRVVDGRIVEHWDVVQPVPETSANSNTMF